VSESSGRRAAAVSSREDRSAAPRSLGFRGVGSRGLAMTRVAGSPCCSSHRDFLASALTSSPAAGMLRRLDSGVSRLPRDFLLHSPWRRESEMGRSPGHGPPTPPRKHARTLTAGCRSSTTGDEGPEHAIELAEANGHGRSSLMLRLWDGESQITTSVVATSAGVAPRVPSITRPLRPGGCWPRVQGVRERTPDRRTPEPPRRSGGRSRPRRTARRSR
jgi:hypothetical protein